MFLHLEREKIRKRLEKRKRAAILCATPNYRSVNDVVAELDTPPREQDDVTVTDMVGSDSDSDSQAIMLVPNVSLQRFHKLSLPSPLPSL